MQEWEDAVKSRKTSKLKPERASQLALKKWGRISQGGRRLLKHADPHTILGLEMPILDFKDRVSGSIAEGNVQISILVSWEKWFLHHFLCFPFVVFDLLDIENVQNFTPWTLIWGILKEKTGAVEKDAPDICSMW